MEQTNFNWLLQYHLKFQFVNFSLARDGEYYPPNNALYQQMIL